MIFGNCLADNEKTARNIIEYTLLGCTLIVAIEIVGWIGWAVKRLAQ